MDSSFCIDKDRQFQCYKERRIFQRFESCVRSSLLFGVSVLGLVSALGVIGVISVSMMSKETPRQQGQSLRPKMKVHCAANDPASPTSCFCIFYIPSQKRKSILELFETEFVFFYSVLCLCPGSFSVAQFQNIIFIHRHL